MRKHKNIYYLSYTIGMDITQLQQLLDDSTTGTGTGISTSSFDINKLMAWIIIPSVVLTLVVCLAFIINIIHRWKVERAIFEIRDILREMKLAQQPVTSNPPSPVPVKAAVPKTEEPLQSSPTIT